MILNKREFKRCSLSAKQLNAAKKVYAAMRKAALVGVTFWDNYGILECYNSNSIGKPKPIYAPYELSENPVTYSENLKNFQYGNADDPLYFDFA